ncbi:hypothetical protein [Phytopseudomonas dryadis]|uniref:hypothetical protein n=1 Tax=Phytopseudomonas dryadis TaxID=2487520 RepID=UPI0010383291|nr:hypothetical protein [Pseudomonas dryadis]
MLTLPQVFDPTRTGAVCRQFYCSLSGRGAEPHGAIPLQKNQLAASPAVLFLLCRSRYVLFLLSWAMLVIVVVPEIEHKPCQYLFFFVNQYLVIFGDGFQA